MGIPAEPSPGDGVHEVDLPPHKPAGRLLVAVGLPGFQQGNIRWNAGVHCQLMYGRGFAGHNPELFLQATAEGDSQSIGDIRRRGRLLESPALLDGPLDLHFTGMAVSNDGFFYPIGGKLLDFDLPPPRRQQDHAAGVAHQNGRTRMGIMGVQLLNSADIGIEFFQ